MSSLVVGFTVRMSKRAANAQGQGTPGSEGINGKPFKQFGPTKEVQISSAVIAIDSLERALGALPALEGNARGASREACASLEDRALVKEPPLDDEVANEALHVDEVGGPLPRARWPSLALSKARKTRLP